MEVLCSNRFFLAFDLCTVREVVCQRFQVTWLTGKRLRSALAKKFKLYRGIQSSNGDLVKGFDAFGGDPATVTAT